MDQVKNSVPILCIDHKKQPLSLVNPDPSSSKHVYCFECLMQAEDPKSLYKSFSTIEDFIFQATAIFSEQKSQIKPVQEVPKEFLEVVPSKAESLEKLSKHITEEKNKIETFFEVITNFVVDVIDQLKNEHLEILEKQVTNLQENYTTFEKMLKRLYPKKEDIETMFPTKEDLDMKLERTSTALDLEELVKGLKQTLSFSKHEIPIINQSHEYKQSYLRQFDDRLKNIENKKPVFDQKYSEQDIKEQIKAQLSQLFGLEKAFFLKDFILTDMSKPEYHQSDPESTIISSQQFSVLKSWLPDQTTFNPKLLYRMTRDGKDSQKFYSQVEKRGPTITLIRCRYIDASRSSIIGGFLDKDMDHQNSEWVSSDQAFVFSLTSQVKCPIKQIQYAAYSSNNHEVWFGYCGTIGVAHNFTLCISKINSNQAHYTYENCEKIIPSECYKGPDKEHNFVLEELEVYSVS